MSRNFERCERRAFIEPSTDGLGYIRHPTLAPDLSIISVFHELHCLVRVLKCNNLESLRLITSHSICFGEHTTRRQMEGKFLTLALTEASTLRIALTTFDKASFAQRTQHLSLPSKKSTATPTGAFSVNVEALTKSKIGQRHGGCLMLKALLPHFRTDMTIATDHSAV